jgi:hypothetical protein
VIDMATLSSSDMITADELPGREKTHIDGGPIGIAVLDDYRGAATGTPYYQWEYHYGRHTQLERHWVLVR